MTFRVKDGSSWAALLARSLAHRHRRADVPAEQLDGVTITFGREGEKVVGLTLKPNSGEQVAYKRVEGK